MAQAGNEQGPAGTSRVWNFHPHLPISMSPVFDLPPKPKEALRWLLGTWLKITPPVNHLLFALVAHWFLWPSMAVMHEFSIVWALQIFAINLGATLILGTALHTYLYVFSAQQTRLKFDVRPMEKSIRFTSSFTCSHSVSALCYLMQVSTKCCSETKRRLKQVLFTINFITDILNAIMVLRRCRWIDGSVVSTMALQQPRNAFVLVRS